MSAMELRFSSDAVVVVAGVPGAGKTTLIRRAVDPAVVRVVDTQDRRERGERASYLGHYARIVGAVAGRRPVVIHSRARMPWPGGRSRCSPAFGAVPCTS